MKPVPQPLTEAEESCLYRVHKLGGAVIQGTSGLLAGGVIIPHIRATVLRLQSFGMLTRVLEKRWEISEQGRARVAILGTTKRGREIMARVDAEEETNDAED